jgi:hypothetical protein
MQVNLKMINNNGTTLIFEAKVLNSTDNKLTLSLRKNSDISNIQINTRFIIGEFYPRAYKVCGINEFDLYNDENISMTLLLDNFDLLDDLTNFIAHNV